MIRAAEDLAPTVLVDLRRIVAHFYGEQIAEAADLLSMDPRIPELLARDCERFARAVERHRRSRDLCDTSARALLRHRLVALRRRLRPELTWYIPTITGIAVVEGRPFCRRCGCTEERACAGGCGWKECSGGGSLCTRCA